MWWCCTPRPADAPAVGAVLSVISAVKLEDGARVSGMRVINQCIITNHPCGSAKEEKGKGVGRRCSSQVHKKLGTPDFFSVSGGRENNGDIKVGVREPPFGSTHGLDIKEKDAVNLK